MNLSWLNRERLVVYSAMIFIGYLITALIFFIMARDQVRDGQNPMVTDFNAFYAVSTLANSGPLSAAYDRTRLKQVEIQVADEMYATKLSAKQANSIKLSPWMYPPTMPVLLLPLRHMPYAIAYAVWVVVTLMIFLAAIRVIAPHSAAPLIALSFPGIFVNLMFGQNGFLTAGLLGLGLGLMDRRPIWAGICFGLLSSKPHLGLLIPVALLVGGYWRVFFSAVAATLAFATISLLVFGVDPWGAFLQNMLGTGEVMERGVSPWTMMPTMFAATRLSGGSVTIAYALQGIMLAAAIAVVIWAWHSKKGAPDKGPLKAAALCLAILLATPFAYTYDLTIMALALAWLGWDIHLRGWRKWEAPIMLTAFVLPFASPAITHLVPVQIGPVVIALLLGVIIARMRGQRPQRPSIA